MTIWTATFSAEDNDLHNSRQYRGAMSVDETRQPDFTALQFMQQIAVISDGSKIFLRSP